MPKQRPAKRGMRLWQPWKHDRPCVALVCCSFFSGGARRGRQIVPLGRADLRELRPEARPRRRMSHMRRPSVGPLRSTQRKVKKVRIAVPICIFFAQLSASETSVDSNVGSQPLPLLPVVSSGTPLYVSPFQHASPGPISPKAHESGRVLERSVSGI